MVGVARFELAALRSRTVRATKLRYTPKKLFNFISAHPFIGDDTLLRYTPKKLFNFISAHPFIGDDALLRYTPKRNYSFVMAELPSGD